MSRTMLLAGLVGWPVAVTASAASRFLWTGGSSAAENAIWLTMAALPVIGAIALARSRPGRSIAEILSDTDPPAGARVPGVARHD